MSDDPCAGSSAAPHLDMPGNGLRAWAEHSDAELEDEA
jgi:hypothetical protein